MVARTTSDRILAELAIQRLKSEMADLQSKASSLAALKPNKIIAPSFVEIATFVVGLLVIATGFLVLNTPGRNGCGTILFGIVLLTAYMLVRIKRTSRAKRYQSAKLKEWSERTMELQHELETNRRVLIS